MAEQGMTKHAALEAWIYNKIRDGTFKAGDRLISENELCDLFGVSRHTVRHALDTLEGEGFLDRRRGSGTYIRFNGGAHRGLTNTVGVILSYLESYIFPGILRGIESVMTNAGYSLMLGITYNKVENERRLLEEYMAKGVDGILVEATKSALPNPNIDLYEKLTRTQTPLMFFNCYYRELGCNYVVMDDRKGARMATARLLDAGHRRLGGVFKLDDMQGKERYCGFTEALHQRGLAIPEDAVLWYATEDADSLFSGEFDRMILKKFRDCTGIVCYNDLVAVGLIDLFARNGIRVPERVSVTGFDNAGLSGAGSVRLTTVTHPGEKLGEKAAEYLCQALRGGPKLRRFVFEPELIEGESVCPPQPVH